MLETNFYILFKFVTHSRGIATAQGLTHTEQTLFRNGFRVLGLHI